MRRVLGTVGKRLLFLPLALFIVASLAFLLVNVLPGDPVGVIAGPAASEEQILEIRTRLGLDLPLGQRYLSFMAALIRFDLGASLYTNRPITGEIARFLPNTLELIFMSIIVAGILGATLGIIGAYWQGRKADGVSRFVVTISQSIPDFFLALLLIYFVYYLAGLAPSPVGRLGLLETRPEPITGALLLDTLITREWELFRSALRQSILPVATLGFYYSAYVAKTMRSALGRAMTSKQVEYARACGLSEPRVLYYGLRQALIPVLTYAGILLAALIGGAAIVELIFSWGGVGEWAIQVMLQLDMPAIQGVIVAAGFGTLLVFIVLDLLVAAIDPRISYE